MITQPGFHSPCLARIGETLSLIGTMTNIAFIAQSDMTYDMAQFGSSAQFIALWNGSTVMRS